MWDINLLHQLALLWLWSRSLRELFLSPGTFPVHLAELYLTEAQDSSHTSACNAGMNYHDTSFMRPCSRIGLEELSRLVRDTTHVLKDLSRPIPLPSTLCNITRSVIQDAINPLTRHVIILEPQQANYQQFRYLWSRSLPFVVNIGDKLQFPWSPSHLQKNYGNQRCQIQNCESGDLQESALSRFLNKMESGGDGTQIFRVKVWFTPPV